jgi:hypothetical protein
LHIRKHLLVLVMGLEVIKINYRAKVWWGPITCTCINWTTVLMSWPFKYDDFSSHSPCIFFTPLKAKKFGKRKLNIFLVLIWVKFILKRKFGLRLPNFFKVKKIFGGEKSSLLQIYGCCMLPLFLVWFSFVFYSYYPSNKKIWVFNYKIKCKLSLTLWRVKPWQLKKW